VRPYGIGGLIFGAEPADVAVAFFFGTFHIEGNETFEDLLVEGLALIPSPSPAGLLRTHKSCCIRMLPGITGEF